jgi:hypothetical protein
MPVSRFQSFNIERINRSQITPAPWNPRQIDAHAKRLLSTSLKKHGLIMPLVMNRRTGRLVAGHQRLNDLDQKENYAKGNDYELDVAVIEVDEKAEKELAIFVNNQNAQGSWDLELLTNLLQTDLNLENTGFTSVDLGILLGSADLTQSPLVEQPAPPPMSDGTRQTDDDQAALAQQSAVARSANAPQARPAPPGPERPEITEEERLRLREVKAELKAKPDVQQSEFYLVVVFKDGARREEFLAACKLDQTTQYVSGETLFDILNAQD